MPQPTNQTLVDLVHKLALLDVEREELTTAILTIANEADLPDQVIVVDRLVTFIDRDHPDGDVAVTRVPRIG